MSKGPLDIDTHHTKTSLEAMLMESMDRLEKLESLMETSISKLHVISAHLNTHANILRKVGIVTEDEYHILLQRAFADLMNDLDEQRQQIIEVQMFNEMVASNSDIGHA